MATTKRTLQAPTLNNSGQITGGSSAPGGYLRKLPNELPGGDGPNSVRVIQTPQTNDSGNITGGNGVRTGTNTAEDPSTYNFTSITGVKQNTGNRVVVDGKEYILDGGARNATQNRTAAPSTTFKDNSAVLATAGKTGTTNNLAGGRTDSLPGVTKYAGNNKLYGNNRAGIDLVNSQNELDNLSEAEKAQRLAGAYNPTPLPTVATTQNPVVKKTLPKEETPVMPDIQAMDLPTIQENIDRLTYKVNTGKALTEDEYVTFNQLRRQATEMMKPQSLKGGLDNLMQQQQNEITTTQQTQEAQNAKDLEAFTKSQEAYKASQIAMIEREEELSRQRMAAIFGATGQDSSTDTISNFSEMEQNYTLRKQAKIEEVQAKIDLFESQQRKDSAETIQKMKDRLYNTQLKAAEYDVKDIEAVNAFNKEQSKSVLDSLDKLKAASDGIIASSTPLTEDQKKQAEVIANLLIDDKGNLDKTLLDSYGKTHPNLIPFATSLAVDLKKKAQENNLLMLGLDADIKRAQLNKLLNPEKPDETFTYEDNGDGTFIAKGNRGTFKTVDSSGGIVTSKTPGGVPISQAIQTALDKCKNGAQCGKFVNDILEGVGYGRMIGNSYDSKVQTINKIGVATTINDVATGSVFAYPVKGSEYGHIGIVTGKNADGTINIMDYNYKGDEQQREKLNVNPSEIFNLGGSISKPIVVDSTVPTKSANLEQPSGKKQLPAGNASEIGAMRTAIDQTSNLGSIIEKYKDSMGPIAGNIGKINKFDTKAQTANAEFNRITQIIGKSLEGGKLAEGDIKRYLEMLPNITDNPEVAKNKLVSSQQYLKDLYSGQVKSLGEAGYNVKNFYSGIENKQEEQIQTTADPLGLGI